MVGVRVSAVVVCPGEREPAGSGDRVYHEAAGVGTAADRDRVVGGAHPALHTPYRAHRPLTRLHRRQRHHHQRRRALQQTHALSAQTDRQRAAQIARAQTHGQTHTHISPAEEAAAEKLKFQLVELIGGFESRSVRPNRPTARCPNSTRTDTWTDTRTSALQRRQRRKNSNSI